MGILNLIIYTYCTTLSHLLQYGHSPGWHRLSQSQAYKHNVIRLGGAGQRDCRLEIHFIPRLQFMTRLQCDSKLTVEPMRML